MARDQFNKQSLGGCLNTLVKEARLLLVGAGGIGCELLKNLVLSGFGEIHIVDLDTIDLSNLNRQFLFRHEHIKKSKAFVAKNAAQIFNPNVKLEAYMANITDNQFNTQWYEKFTMVFNALDNLQARRHVNKMCIAANIPLIESGTTGFNGQVQIIKRGLTACYDCTPKETPKSFPTCTIRSTPSQPIHCIVWAKSYLLTEIFGVSEEESPEIDLAEKSENAVEIENLRRETAALRKIRENMGLESFSQLLFDKAYKHDIERLRSMDDLWKTRRAPVPLEYVNIFAQATETGVSIENVIKNSQTPWSIEENLIVFMDSLARLSKRMLEMKTFKSEDDPDPVISFDKDDEDTLDFVTSSANLRSIVFGIETKSKFDIKQMAGNIIPAIATTNAIVAGLCVLQSFKVLDGDFSNTKDIFLSPFGTERLLASDRFQKPNSECTVCSVAYNRVLIDMKIATLNDLVENFLKLELGYDDEITINDGENHLLYDIDETVNLDKKLSELGIKNDSFLTIVDDNNNHSNGPRVNLVLIVHESNATDCKPIVSLDIPVRMENEQKPSSPFILRRKPLQPSHQNGHEIDNINTSDVTIKRPRSPESSDSPGKKPKISSAGATGSAIEVDEDDDGAIIID